MMVYWKFRIMFLLIAYLLIFSTGSKAFTSNQILQDALYLLEMFEEVHPNLYHTTSKEEVDLFLTSWKEDLQANKEYSLLQAYTKLSPLAALFRDAHTNLFFPLEEWNQYLSSGGLLFPFEVRLEGERLLIKDPYDEGRFNGTILLSINGVETDTILYTLLASISYESEAYGAYLFNTRFQHYLFAFFGMEGPFTITYASPTGEEETLSLPGLKIADLPPKEKREPYQLKFLSKKTALLIIDTVPKAMNEEYFLFLKESFQRIKEKNIENLLIDMRTNGGGSTHQFNEVFHYISEIPYRPFSRIDVRYSRPLLKDFPWYSRFYYQIRNIIKGDDIIKREPRLTTPPPNKFPFEGQVYLLVGPGTFSAAADFAALCQDYAAAIIVGQATGGLPTCYGDSFYFNLPQTGLLGRSSYKFFVRPSGEISLQGVIPNWELQIDTDYENLLHRID